MNKHSGKGLFICNIIMPLVIGALLYYILSPNTLFVAGLDNALGGGSHLYMAHKYNSLLRFVRNYFPDMLWAYALVFSLYLIIGNNTAELKKVFRIALAFALIMEVLQLTPLVKGTFDVADIMLECLAEVTAVIVIKIISLRRSY